MILYIIPSKLWIVISNIYKERELLNFWLVTNQKLGELMLNKVYNK